MKLIFRVVIAEGLTGRRSNLIVGDRICLLGRTARVTFSYTAEQEDELSLEVGQIIKNIVDVDVGWCEGELNGKKGMFPNNFVEEVISPETSSDSGEMLIKR